MTKYAQESLRSVVLRLLSCLINQVRKSSLYSNAFYLMLNNVTTSLLGFVFWNIMTRFFPPTQVGIGSALLAASVLIGVLSNMGLGIGLVRFIPGEGEKAGRLVNATFTMTGIMSVLGSLIYLLGIEQWSPGLHFIIDDFWLLVLFVLFTVGTTLSIMTDQSLVASRSARFVFWKNLFVCLFKLPLPVLVMAHLEGYGIFAATGTAILIGILLSWFFFLPLVYRDYSPRPVFEGSLVQKMLSYSFCNYLADLMNRAPTLIYPLMVLNFYGAEQSAYFYIAWMLSMVLEVIPTGMAQSLFVEGSFEPEKLGEFTRKSLTLALALSLTGAGVMILAAGWFLQFFGTGYAENGVTVVRLLAIAVIPQCVNALFLAINQVQKRVGLIVTQSAVLAALALVLGPWMLREAGSVGIAKAYVLAHLTVAFLVLGPLWNLIKKTPQR